MSEDRLHEPYRAEFVPQLPWLVAAARQAGALGAALSGAGSTVLALTDDATVAEHVAQAMADAANDNSLAGRSAVVRPAAHGARVVEAKRT
jgi:homoserine kinase